MAAIFFVLMSTNKQNGALKEFLRLEIYRPSLKSGKYITMSLEYLA